MTTQLIRKRIKLSNMVKEIVKRLKCDVCKRMVQASNKFKDTRFYCMNCGRSLGCREIGSPKA